MVEWLLIFIVMAGIGTSTVVPSPGELVAYFKEGQGLFAVEDYPAAIEKYKRVVKIDSGLLNEDKVVVPVTFEEEVEVPVKLAATYQLGNSHKKIGNYDEAVTHFRKVAQEAPLAPLRSLARYQIITTRYEQGEYQQAVDEAQVLVDLFPESRYAERAYYNMGWAFFQSKQYPQAVEAFSKQLEMFPQGEYAARAQYQIAQSHYDGENYAEAIVAYQLVIELYTPEEFSEQEWSQALLSRLRKRSQTEKSVLRGTEEVNLIELTAKAQLQIGECHNKLDQPREAMEAYRKVTQNFLPLADLVELAYLKMAETAFASDGLEASVKVYRDALDSSSDSKFQAKMQYKIAKLYFQHEEYERSAQEYQIFLDGYEEEAASIGFPPEDAQYAIGLSYYQAQRYARSIEEYQKLVDKHPDSPLVANAFYGIGLNHQMLENLAQAEVAYRQVVENYSQHDQAPIALLQLSRLYQERGDFLEAKKSYLRLLEDYVPAPDVEEDLVLYELGITCRNNGDFEEASSYLRRISPDSKWFAGAISEITEIFIKQGDFERAKLELAAGLEKTEDPGAIAQIRYARARLHVAQQEYRAALDDFGYVIEHIEDPVLRQNALFGRGIIHYQFEEYQDAIPDLELLLTMEADANFKKEARQKLGICYLKTGQKDRALDLAQRLQDAATNPAEKAEAYLIIADLYYELTEYSSGVATARQILSLEDIEDELKAQAYYIMGNNWSGMKDYSQALETYNTALAQYPRSTFRSDLLFQAGIMAYNLENYEAAAVRFREFAEEFSEHPNMVFALYYLAYSQFRRGLWEEARETFGRLTDNYPNSEMIDEAKYQVAECLYNDRQYQEALEAYGRVLRDHPGSRYAEDALYNVAWCQFQLNLEDEAMATLQEVVRRFPQGDYGADAQFTIGDYYYNNKDYDRAKEAYQKILDLFPDSPRAQQAQGIIHELQQITSYLAYQQAVALFDEKKYLLAIEAFGQIIEEYPEADVVVGSWANMGASYEQLSRWDDALKIYNRVIEMYSNFPEHAAAVAFATEHKEWIEETF